MEFSGLSRTERVLLMIALLFIVVVAVKMTAFIVSLFLMSVVITMLGIPVLVRLRERGIPTGSAVALISVIAAIIIGAFLLFANLSFQMLIADIPKFQQELALRTAELTAFFEPLGISFGEDILHSLDLGQIFSMGMAGLSGLSEGLMFLFFVAVTSFFLLLEIPAITLRLEDRFGRDSHTMKQLTRMTGYIIDFIVVRTETNFIHGCLFGGFLWAMGVHAALLWGMLTFLLGYIPYFGLLLAAIPAVFFAWLQFGIPGAVTVIVVVCILNLIVENPLYSYLTARKYEMPALLVIVSVIFWGWLLGLVGMLFSIPCTLMVLLVCQLSDDLRWINVMLGVSHLFEEVGVKPAKHE
jgi:predicted PurR-regulated permease PerM